jgi:branched-chain amino acid transport system permease protein
MSRHLVYYIVGILILLLMPLFTQNEFFYSVFMQIGMFAIMAISMRFMLLTGEPAVGPTGFVAIGAYTSAILTTKLGMSFWLALPAAGLLSMVVGILFGIPALRIKGTYFAIVHLTFVDLVRQIVIHMKGLTGGMVGLYGVPPPAIVIPGLLDFVFRSLIPYYYLLIALLLFTVVVLYRLEVSSVGLSFRSIGWNDRLAESVGTNIMRNKVLCFAIVCLMQGLVGSFWAHYLHYLSPDHFNVMASVYVTIYMVVGGIGSILGPLLGSFVLIILPEFFRAFAQSAMLFYGIFMILVMLFLPGGIYSGLQEILRRAARFSWGTDKAAEG